MSALALFAATVVVLFAWVFPAVSPHLPFEDVTVQATAGDAGASTSSPSSPVSTQK